MLSLYDMYARAQASIILGSVVKYGGLIGGVASVCADETSFAGIGASCCVYVLGDLMQKIPLDAAVERRFETLESRLQPRKSKIILPEEFDDTNVG